MSVTTSKVEDITSTLRAEILRGQYRVGERLPSERDLAARFSSNRGAIRESIKKLEQLGIIEVTPGGVRILPLEEATLEVLGYLLDADETDQPKLVGQMLDVFGAMISLSARSAVSMATADELDELAVMIDRLIETAGKDMDANHENWMVLGEKLLKIHENLVLRLVGNGLRTQFIGQLNSPQIRPEIDYEQIRGALKSFRQAVLDRAPVEAGNAVVLHFEILKIGMLAWIETLSADTPTELRRAEHA